MKKLFLVLVITCLYSSIFPQNVDQSWFREFRTVIPGKHFEAGWFHEFFFGTHWRDVWTTPVRIGVVDLDKYGSGLTPIKKGGGLQTSSLRFKGKDGKEYKFRLLDKDPKKNLPKEIHESIVVDILLDQVCSYNPYAGFVVNDILDAYGIYHTEYTLSILPDDPLLGEYRSEFANMIGIMELVPDITQFEGSDKVIGSIKLLNRLNKEFDESVDGKEYIMARFLDILLGDWDRHKDNWKWIMFEDGKRKIYKPYPMDRDQAFCKLDGIFPWIAEQNVLQLNNFGYDYSNMRYLTWNARYIDQRFLAFMPKDEWEKITNEIYDKFTNELIENAVKKLPAEVYDIAKNEITDKLKSRRDKFKEASEEFYELVNVSTDIYTTDKNDLVLIEFNPILGIGLPLPENEKDLTRISVFKKENNAVDKKGGLIKQKLFDNSITDEIRIYLQDGDDDVVIWGKCDISPKIRIIGGDGKDEIKNNSDENILFYDDGKKSQVSGDVNWDDDKFNLPYELPLKGFMKKKDNLSKEEKDKYEDLIGNLRYEPVLPPDKFDLTSFIPIFTYSPDFGPYFGGTYNYTKYGFRMNPYLYKLQFTLGYAPVKKSLKGLVADFNSDFMGILKRTDINFHVRKSGIELNNYFGMGNNTVYNDSLSASKYYKVEH